MKFPFFRYETLPAGKRVYFQGEKLKIYIPSYYFDQMEGLARTMGQQIETLGLFDFEVFKNEDDKKGVIYEIQIPIMIKFSFSERETGRLKIKSQIPENDYHIFTLYKGDIFMDNIQYKKSSDDTFKFISKLMHGAKLPNTISYDDIMKIYLNMLTISGDKLGVPAFTLEAMISELYRYKKDVSKPYRLRYKPQNPYDYKMVRITKIPEMNSTFSGLASEDVNHQILAGILRNREGKKEMTSPVEKVLKY